MIFKSTAHILNNPWKEDVPNIDPNPKMVPPKTSWTSNNRPDIDDVKLWQQIYYEPGVVGVYASWDPYVDLYMITYNLFMDKDLGVKSFYGPEAEEQVKQELKKLDINLPEYTVWQSS